MKGNFNNVHLSILQLGNLAHTVNRHVNTLLFIIRNGEQCSMGNETLDTCNDSLFAQEIAMNN